MTPRKAQCADRAARARIEQVLRRDQRGQGHHPDQVVGFAVGIQPPAEDGNARQVGDAVVLAEKLRVAERVVGGDRPGDRAEREVVAREPQRDESEDQAASAVRASAARSATQGDTPSSVVSTAVVYAASPTNACWPNEINPRRRSAAPGRA